jgi:hypothetical protein
MARKSAPSKFQRRDEGALLKAAYDALSSDFPNPEPANCRAVSMLEGIVGRRVSVTNIVDVVEGAALGGLPGGGTSN